MSFTAKGRVTNILPEVTGTSAKGDWKKQDFIIENAEEQFPKKICFTTFNDKTGIFSRILIGSEVNVSFRIESREYNEKFFTNLTAWEVEEISNSGVPQSNSEPAPFDSRTPIDKDDKEYDDLPF